MTDSSSPVLQSPGDDPEMEQAAVRARQTLKYFWREMSWEQRRIIPGLELAALKASFSDPPEYIGDPPMKKKGLFSMFGGSKTPTQDYAKVASFEHPVSMNRKFQSTIEARECGQQNDALNPVRDSLSAARYRAPWES